MRLSVPFAVVLAVASFAGCSKNPPAAEKGSTPGSAAAAPAATPPAAKTEAGEEIPPPSYEAALPEELRRIVTVTYDGDFDGMVKRRLIRAGVPFNRTFYFIDQGTQRGLSYEYAMLFEDQLNKKLNTGNLKVHVVLLPMSRDQLLPALLSGKIDLAIAQTTIRPSLLQVADFSIPTRRNVNEILITAPGVPPVTGVEDLSGREVYVRKGSAYHESLTALNRELEAKHKKPVNVQFASDSLEDDDLLEMVNAGLIPATVVDDFIANFWKQVFTNMQVHDRITLRTGGELAVGIRKNSPQLAAELNAFISKNGLDSAVGAILNKRYLQNTKFVRDAASVEERKKFLALIELFRKYGDKYEFDYLMMAAQGYQESRLDQNAKSAVGAIGIMQVMPETGAEQKVGDIRQIDPNIHAGVKYMRFIRNSFFEKEPMDDVNKALFTFAAYNAGPGRVRQLRREAEQRGLNPNVWFGSVERIASERIGRETCTYVSNIYKYYVAYRLMAAERERKKAATTGGH